MTRWFLLGGSLSGGLAVAAGAFGAHGLRDHLDGRLFETFEIAVRYQMYHALALLAVAWVAGRRPGTPVRAAGVCFVGGTVIFSGSLYVISLGGPRWLGMVTPLGGVALLCGWLLLAVAAWRAPAE